MPITKQNGRTRLSKSRAGIHTRRERKMKKGKKFSSRPKTHRDRWARDTDRIDAHRKQIRATESRRDEGIGETVAYTKREHRSVVERHHENSSPKILEPILPRLVF